MTDVEWMNCQDPARMLASLPGKASERHMLRFSVACCRRAWRLLADERSRRAIQTAEACADGSFPLQERELVVAEAASAFAVFEPFGEAGDVDPDYPALAAWYAAGALLACLRPPHDASPQVASALALQAAYERHGGSPTGNGAGCS